MDLTKTLRPPRWIRGVLRQPRGPPSTTRPVSEREPSSVTLEQEVASEPGIGPDEVILLDTQLGRVASERPAVVPELPSVEIVPLSELDTSSTALEPELASALTRQADEVILDAAACESPVPAPASPPFDELLHSSNPPAAGRDPNPLGSEAGDSAGICLRTFPPVASSVPAARSFAAHALSDIPPDAVEDIRLMVSELATTPPNTPRPAFSSPSTAAGRRSALRSATAAARHQPGNLPEPTRSTDEAYRSSTCSLPIGGWSANQTQPRPSGSSLSSLQRPAQCRRLSGRRR